MLGRIVSIIVSLFLVTGCSSITPELGFKEVNDSVTERSGNYLHWNNGTEEDKIIESKIDELLSLELTPETATQVALLKNRNFQATLKELGIAQADLVSAGLLPNPILEGELFFPGKGVSLDLSIVQNL